MFVRSVLVLLSCAVMAACSTQSKRHCDDFNLSIVIVNPAADLSASAKSALLSGVQSSFHDQGHTVIDLESSSWGGRDTNRITRTEAIDLARSLGKNIDYLVYVDATLQRRSSKARLSVNAELIDVHTGRFSGSAEAKGQTVYFDSSCGSRCLSERLAQTGRAAGLDLGQFLDDRLSATSGNCATSTKVTDSYSQTFEIQIDNFTPEEANQIEIALEALAGYQSHRLVYQGNRLKTLSYQTELGTAELLRKVTKLLNANDLRAYTQFAGNTLLIEKSINQRSRPKTVIDDGYEW